MRNVCGRSTTRTGATTWDARPRREEPLDDAPLTLWSPDRYDGSVCCGDDWLSADTAGKELPPPDEDIVRVVVVEELTADNLSQDEQYTMT